MTDPHPQAKGGTLKPPSGLEMFTASPLTGAAAGIVGVLAGDFAGLLPSLFDTLARGRQIERVEESLRLLDEQLQHLGASVRSLSDDQYKVATDAVAAMYATVGTDKLRLLRAAAVGAAMSPQLVQHVATPLGRLLRDLSVAEVEFMIKNHEAPGIIIEKPIPGAKPMEWTDGRIHITRGSTEEAVMSGLVSLGLLYVSESTWDHAIFAWSPLVPKLVALLTTSAK